MNRIRTIKPEWLEDERMLSASPEARVLSIALILLADDHGRGRAGFIESRVFPTNPKLFAPAFAELEKMQFVMSYTADGQRYYAIRNWSKHQKVDKPGKPRVPPPNEMIADTYETPEKIPEILATSQEILALDRDRDRDQDQDRDHSCPAPKIVASPTVLVYPCQGAEKTWNLTEAHVSEWAALFPSLNILDECRHALAWVSASPGKRKTARGMPRYLVGWFTRSVNRGQQRTGPVRTGTPAPMYRTLGPS